jgi:hypothetical protein
MAVSPPSMRIAHRVFTLAFVPFVAALLSGRAVLMGAATILAGIAGLAVAQLLLWNVHGVTEAWASVKLEGPRARRLDRQPEIFRTAAYGRFFGGLATVVSCLFIVGGIAAAT